MDEFPEPKVGANDNRYVQCQMAVELLLRDIVDRAVAVGWKETEVLSAIVEVGDNLMLAAGANEQLNNLLAALKRPPD